MNISKGVYGVFIEKFQQLKCSHHFRKNIDSKHEICCKIDKLTFDNTENDLENSIKFEKNFNRVHLRSSEWT